jgi:beta-lactamase class C
MPMQMTKAAITASGLWLAVLVPVETHASESPAGVENIVAAVVGPVMRQYGIPGMAVGIVFNGQRYVCNFGLASKATGRKVNNNTLFEIGSVSKTFNATLATYAQARKALAFSDMTPKYLSDLHASGFADISLADLGTYTPGGLPLQVPDGINSTAELMAYLKHWKPDYPAGTVRLYSNVSIGLLGLVSASSLKQDYTTLVQTQMFPALGLTHSFIKIPAREMPNYAQGYADDDTPIRMSAGVLAPETYAVRTTAGDLARFIAINTGMIRGGAWQQAVIATHTGYDQLQAGGMVQDLVWEQYRLPVDLAELEAGNSATVLLQPQPVKPFAPPSPPRADVLLDKTGSTNGFSAYVAYVPAHQSGIVLLANRSYPIPARVAAAFAILTRLDATALGK